MPYESLRTAAFAAVAIEDSLLLSHPDLDTLERLAIVAEYRDGGTSRHTARVGETSARLARALGKRPSVPAWPPGGCRPRRDHASLQFPVRWTCG